MSIKLFVNGTLMRGLTLHKNLEGAEFLGSYETAPRYRIYSINSPIETKWAAEHVGYIWKTIYFNYLCIYSFILGFSSYFLQSFMANKINVFMDSIGQEIPEYLVNIDFVIDEMRKIGLEPDKPSVSEKYSKIIKSGHEGFDSILESLSNSPKYLDSQKKFYPNLQKITLQEQFGIHHYGYLILQWC